MAAGQVREVVISSEFSAKLVKWHVRDGKEIREGSLLGFYQRLDVGEEAETCVKKPKLKSPFNGKIRKLLVAEGDVIPASAPVALVEEVGECEHKTVMKELCCDCGVDLRRLSEMGEPSSPTVPMIHNIPELRVSLDEAEALGKKDKENLIQKRKLDLVVDLDQTLIHTTMELVPSDMEGVHHFRLPGHPVWYHTKIRPGTFQFLKKISELYQLHIFTMGSRVYAHTIARILDPTEKLFAHRIRSRDECLNVFSKSHDLGSLFPHGDSMVCIIDDREDVWNFASNLIRVKPYQFFKGVGDINAPPAEKNPVSGEGESNNEQNNSVEENTNEEKGPTVMANSNKQEDTEVTHSVIEKGEELTATKARANEDEVSTYVSETTNGPRVQNSEEETMVEEEGSTGNDVNNGVNKEACEGEQSDIKSAMKVTNGGDETGEEKDQTNKQRKEAVTSEQNQNSVENNPIEKETGGELPERERQVNYKIEDNDDYLMHLEDILRRIHALFYQTLELSESKGTKEATKDPIVSRYCPPGTCTPDTKLVVSKMKSDVLRGANLTFTGVIPTNVRSEDSRPWREACALGAKVSKQVIRPKGTNCPSDVTTHVIAARLGTQKSYLAVKSPGVKLVNPEWLNCCAERWEWVDERLFPVEGVERYKEQVSGQRTPRVRSRGSTPQPTEEERIQGSNSEGASESNESSRQRSDSASSADLLMSTINPLLSFSASEVQAMDKEVEDLMNSSDESDVDLLGSVSDFSSSNSSSGSSSLPSVDAQNITGTANKRKRSSQEKHSADEKKQRTDSSDSNDCTSSSEPSDDDDEMAQLLEAELAQD